MIGKRFDYCPLCGSTLVERHIEQEKKTRRVCPACEFIHYQNPTPAAGIILVENKRVLLVKRKFEPRAGQWTLPAGFVESDEDVLSCAVREAKEETNLDIEVVRLFNVYSALDDPRAKVVLILYLGKHVGGKLKPGDDASEAEFFQLNDLPEAIAFRAHRRALAEIKAQHADGLL